MLILMFALLLIPGDAIPLPEYLEYTDDMLEFNPQVFLGYGDSLVAIDEFLVTPDTVIVDTLYVKGLVTFEHMPIFPSADWLW